MLRRSGPLCSAGRHSVPLHSTDADDYSNTPDPVQSSSPGAPPRTAMSAAASGWKRCGFFGVYMLWCSVVAVNWIGRLVSRLNCRTSPQQAAGSSLVDSESRQTKNNKKRLLRPDMHFAKKLSIDYENVLHNRFILESVRYTL